MKKEFEILKFKSDDTNDNNQEKVVLMVKNSMGHDLSESMCAGEQQPQSRIGIAIPIEETKTPNRKEKSLEDSYSDSISQLSVNQIELSSRISYDKDETTKEEKKFNPVKFDSLPKMEHEDCHPKILIVDDDTF